MKLEAITYDAHLLDARADQTENGQSKLNVVILSSTALGIATGYRCTIELIIVAWAMAEKRGHN